MTLGVDRDSELVADIFDERNEAVTRMIEHVISVAKKRKARWACVVMQFYGCVLSFSNIEKKLIADLPIRMLSHQNALRWLQHRLLFYE